MAQSQNKEPTNQDLIAALRAMMTGPIEKIESHEGRDLALTMRSALKRAFSHEDYAKFLWRLRYKRGRNVQEV